jgi:hypothetical protein
VCKDFFKNTIQKRSKMVLDIPKGVEDINKAEKKVEETNLKEKTETISIGGRGRFEKEY